MITVGMNYNVLEGKGELFESVFNKVLQVMQELEGHQDSRLYRDTNDQQSYLIVSEWSDRAAFDGFIASERFRNVANWGKDEVLAGRPRHDVYETPDAAPPADSKPAGGGKCPMGFG